MSFAAQVASFSLKTKSKLHRIRKGVLFKLFGAVIFDTPVLTGRLRANWRYSEGKPDFSTDHNEDKAGTATVAKVEAGVLESTGEVPVFLSNSLPYAARIEFDGWSHTKAPEGMMRKNVVRFNNLVIEANRVA